MNELLERRFAAIGARVRVPSGPWRGDPRIDVLVDGGGEHFDLSFGRGSRPVALEVVDVQPRDRHLLLLARQDEGKSKFLCGHDERHWFVAAVPETARGVTGVAAAKRALQPEAIQRLVQVAKPKDPFRRRNDVYVRQGEWFFVPAPGIVAQPQRVTRYEPLTRGRGKAHVLELAYRRGGETVYVDTRGSGRVRTGAEFNRLPRETQRWFRPMTRNPQLFAKGAVRHPDHATIVLREWHQVLMNTEGQARAMQHVVFLD